MFLTREEKSMEFLKLIFLIIGALVYTFLFKAFGYWMTKWLKQELLRCVFVNGFSLTIAIWAGVNGFGAGSGDPMSLRDAAVLYVSVQIVWLVRDLIYLYYGLEDPEPPKPPWEK